VSCYYAKLLRCDAREACHPCSQHSTAEIVQTDREKWERRYSEDSGDLPEPDDFLVLHAHLLSCGRALDPACGLGGNSVFLAERGYEVTALDISYTALARLKDTARRRHLPIDCVVADLDYFPLPANAYDVAVVFYFFSERFIAALKQALRPRGLLFYATYNERHTSVRPTFNPAYLVAADGLAVHFPDFDSLVHETWAGDQGNISQLIARKM